MERWVRPAKTLVSCWPSGEPNHWTANRPRGRPGAGVRGGRGAGGVLGSLAATATDGHPGAAEALGAAKAGPMSDFDFSALQGNRRDLRSEPLGGAGGFRSAVQENRRDLSFGCA